MQINSQCLVSDRVCGSEGAKVPATTVFIQIKAAEWRNNYIQIRIMMMSPVAFLCVRVPVQFTRPDLITVLCGQNNTTEIIKKLHIITAAATRDDD